MVGPETVPAVTEATRRAPRYPLARLAQGARPCEPGRGQRRYGTTMATLDDAALVAAALPEVTEGESRGNRTWSVGGKAFAWDHY